MGTELVKFYTLIGDEMGLVGKTKLAVATKIPSTKAAMEPDTPENMDKFRKAFEELTGKPAPK